MMIVFSLKPESGCVTIKVWQSKWREKSKKIQFIGVFSLSNASFGSKMEEMFLKNAKKSIMTQTE